MQYFYTLLVAILSYNLCNLFTHPKSKIWNNYPKLKIKKLEILPSIRILVKGKVIHFHHWFNFSVLLCVSIFVTGGILDSYITKGFLLGGIVQGLSIPSARKLVYKEDWLIQMLKSKV